MERDVKDASKPVARHFYLSSHSKKHMTICGFTSLTPGQHGSRKNLKQKFIFQIEINEYGFSFNSYILVFYITMFQLRA